MRLLEDLVHGRSLVGGQRVVGFLGHEGVILLFGLVEQGLAALALPTDDAVAVEHVGAVGLLKVAEGVLAHKEAERGILVDAFDELIPVDGLVVDVKTGAQALGRPVGRYITVDLRPYFDRQRTFFHRAVWCIAQQLRALLPDAGPRSQILVAGLGNRAMTPDAIGPAAVENLLVTRHMVRTLPRQFQGFTPVSALCTGVLARTGLETLELIQGAAAHIRPTAVIAIDALAARSRDWLCATVQLSDTGLTPGSGVGNHRRAVDRAALGVPVIAVGVPTVIDGATLCADLLEEAGCPRQALCGRGADLFVTPQDIDQRVTELGRMVGYGITLALQRGLTLEDVTGLLG